MFQAHLYFHWPSPGISHFSNESWFIKNSIQRPRTGCWVSYIYLSTLKVVSSHCHLQFHSKGTWFILFPSILKLLSPTMRNKAPTIFTILTYLNNLCVAYMNPLFTACMPWSSLGLCQTTEPLSPPSTLDILHTPLQLTYSMLRPSSTQTPSLPRPSSKHRKRNTTMFEGTFLTLVRQQNTLWVKEVGKVDSWCRCFLTELFRKGRDKVSEKQRQY